MQVLNHEAASLNAQGKYREGLAVAQRAVELSDSTPPAQPPVLAASIRTLWPVQDDGSAALMHAFYAARGEQRQMSKAQALQHAQLQLLGGKLKSRNSAIDLRHPLLLGAVHP